MVASQVYILIAVVVLAIIALVRLFLDKSKKNKKLTPLAGLAFAFVLAGILFGDDRLIGYTLLGVGVLLALADIFMELKKK